MTAAPDTPLTPEERAEFDYWMQRVQSNEANEALFRSLRLMVRHETAGLRMALPGYVELVDRIILAQDATQQQVTALIGVVDRHETMLQQHRQRLEAVEAQDQRLIALEQAQAAILSLVQSQELRMTTLGATIQRVVTGDDLAAPTPAGPLTGVAYVALALAILAILSQVVLVTGAL